MEDNLDSNELNIVELKLTIHATIIWSYLKMSFQIGMVLKQHIFVKENWIVQVKQIF